jgi:hypothetical protein
MKAGLRNQHREALFHVFRIFLVGEPLDRQQFSGSNRIEVPAGDFDGTRQQRVKNCKKNHRRNRPSSPLMQPPGWSGRNVPRI